MSQVLERKQPDREKSRARPTGTNSTQYRYILFKGSGLTRFKQFGGSSVERCVELLERAASIENDPKY